MRGTSRRGRDERDEFGAAWARLEPDLRRSLSSAPAHVVDDVLQETSIKLLRIWDSIDHDRPALPLAITIARNTLRDELRRTARHSHVELSEEARVRDDLDAVVSARLTLASVRSALPRLTPAQREALLTEVGGGVRAPDSPKVKMLRSRARARLREIVAQAGGFVGAGLVRLRNSAAGRAAAGVPELGVLAQTLLLVVVAAGAAGPLGGDVPGTDRLDRPGPMAVAADAAGHRPAAVRPGHAAALAGRGAAAARGPVVAATPDAPGGGGGSPLDPVLPPAPIPRSHGSATDEGHFGTEGFSQAGGIGHSAAGHQVGSRYEGEWESPGCVQRLGEGQAPGECDAPESPHAEAEVEVDGQRHRVGTDGPRG